MKNLFIELLDTVNQIDRKIIRDFDDPKIETTAEMVELWEDLKRGIDYLKTFSDKAETYAANNC